MTGNDHGRVTKRSSNACSRCRRQKIKCSGLHPCANCSKRSVSCVFDDRDNKILVAQGYLYDLQEKVARLERNQTVERQSPSSHRAEPQTAPDETNRREPQRDVAQNDNGTRSSGDGTRESSPSSGLGNPDMPELTNELTAAPKFMSSSKGRAFYLGTSSNWSFHGRVLGLVHEHVRHSPFPSADLLFDGHAYDSWDGTQSTENTPSPVIPGIDYAIYLINAVKFHCGQLVHLFDEEEFMVNLHAFYSDTQNSIGRDRLWYIHFLLIIAFGKTFVRHEHHSSRPPGAEFFNKVLELLPDVSNLCREPMRSIEILCCKALYLQALDSRNAAHVTIGQAMRLAMAEGMHTDIPIAEFGDKMTQRCRKAWWTVYVLDRQMTSLMGLPQSIRDDDISCQLPTFTGSPQRTAALNMQIKLARILAEIYETVYGKKGRLNKRFVVSIKAVLEGIVTLADELRQSFPLHADDRFGGIVTLADELRQSFPLHADDRFGGISRSPAQLHLLYYQTIVIATRPILFCCLKKRFEAPRQAAALVASRKIRHLLNLALESSQKILNILGSLHDQGLLETFLPWDMDSLFVSTLELLITRFVDSTLLESGFPWLERAYMFFDAMIAGGNRIAKFRKTELRKLDEMLSEYAATQGQPTFSPLPNQGLIPVDHSNLPVPYASGSGVAGVQMTCPESMQYYGSISDEGSGYGDELTAEQILAVAETMDMDGTDWMSFATMETLPLNDDMMFHRGTL